MSIENKMNHQPIMVEIIPRHDQKPTRIYANHCEIMHSPFDFTIRFCDVPPLNTSGITPGEKVLLTAPIVAEIALPVALVPSLIRALEENYNLYRKSSEESSHVIMPTKDDSYH
ncbi:MAG: DUF3467 domain-containing protein [Deltaproteobacteria bacterium]|nr:DUF3467 domain-containing protein [Deltaproteobacteria bacterium]